MVVQFDIGFQTADTFPQQNFGNRYIKCYIYKKLYVKYIKRLYHYHIQICIRVRGIYLTVATSLHQFCRISLKENMITSINRLTVQYKSQSCINMQMSFIYQGKGAGFKG